MGNWLIRLLDALGVGKQLRRMGILGSEGVGFREWVRNPKHRLRMRDMFAERDEVVSQLSKLPPDELVALLLEDDFDVPKRAVEAAGPRVVPALIAALSDERFQRPTSPQQQEKAHVFSRRSRPMVTVLECLTEFAPREAVPLVAPMTRDSDEDVRKHVALLVGAVGADECVEPLMVWCQDEDDHARDYAIMGVLRAIRAERVSEAFRAGAFRAIEPLLYRRDQTVSGDTPQCLLGLDRSRAIAIMTAAENLRPDRQGLQYVLRALRESNVAVGEEHLLNLISALEGVADKYPNEYILEEAILLLARVESNAAEQAIRQAASSSSPKVREASARALAVRLGVCDPFGFAWKQLDALDWERITPNQRHVLAVREYIDEVCNGGLSQYFVNPSGARWKDALAGLRDIGATSEAQTLEKATALFGANGPSADVDQRHRQLARLVKSCGDDVFSACEMELYSKHADVEVLLLRFIMQHADEFKAAD